jgi:hypothetical protein
MDRRDFLLLRIAGPHDAELSCERLYMRWVDAAASGTKRELFDSLRADLLKTKAVRVNGREWLAQSELREQVERMLSEFAAAGGSVESATASGE